MRVITLYDIDEPGEMFDGIIDSQSEGADELTATFAVDGMNSVAIFNTFGVEATLEIGAMYITVSLIRDSIKDWWDYWFAPSRIGRDVVFYFPTQPPGTDATITITYNGSTAKCGLCVKGIARQYGWTLYGIDIGITDYSRIATDGFGQTYLLEGRWAKRAVCPLVMHNDDFNPVYLDIVNNRGTATIFDYNSQEVALGDLTEIVAGIGLQFLIIYGFTEDFYLTANWPSHSKAMHEVQGLT